MKRRNLKPIIISALTAVAFGGLSVGTTFALFTDNAETSINVQAGIVDVKQELAIVSVSELGNVAVAANQGVYTNSVGGKTYIDSVNSKMLHLEKWVPGDKVVLTLTNTNDSNVAIKTRFNESHSSNTNPDLYDALNITYSFAGGYTEAITSENYKKRTVLPVAETTNHNISTLTVTIEFPDSHNGAITFGSQNNDNKYQNTDCTIVFAQEAVQGNAYIPDTSYGFADSKYVEAQGNVPAHYVHEIATPAQYNAIAAAMNNSTISTEYTVFKLVADLDFSEVAPEPSADFKGVFDGNNHSITHINLVGTNYTGLLGSYVSNAIVKNLTFDYVTVEGSTSVGILFGGHSNSEFGATKIGTSLSFDHITIGSHCSISGTKSLGSLVGKSQCYETLSFSYCTNNAEVFATESHAGGLTGSGSYVKTLNIDHCVNNGKITSLTGYLGGLGSAFHTATTINISNSTNNGNLYTYTNETNGDVGCHGYLLGRYKGTITASNNHNTGTMYHDHVWSTYSKDGFPQEESNSIISSDEMHHTKVDAISSTTLTLDSNKQFDNLNEVSGATSYKASFSVATLSVAKKDSHTVDAKMANSYNYGRTFSSFADLTAGYGHVTRVGYLLDPTITDFTASVDSSYANNGGLTFFRTSALPTGITADQMTKVNGEFLLVHNMDADFVKSSYATIFRPLGGDVNYNVYAFDSNGAILKKYGYNATIGSGTELKNLSGDEYDSSTQYSGYHDYVA